MTRRAIVPYDVYKDWRAFTVYPDRIWLGPWGNPYHSAEWSYLPEKDWPIGGSPITRGYYRPFEKALYFYETPSPHDLLRVKRFFAQRGMAVKITDWTKFKELKKRYAKRDFSKMRPESIMTREDLIEAIVEASLTPEQKKARRKKWGKRAGIGAAAGVGTYASIRLAARAMGYHPAISTRDFLSDRIHR